MAALAAPAPASLLDLPQCLVLRIQVAAGDAAAICALEAAATPVPRTDEAAWAGVVGELFPALAARLCVEGFDGSYKQLFARRARRAEEWRRRRELQQRPRSGAEGHAAPEKKKPHNKLLFGDNRQGALADSTLRLKLCSRCGEKYGASVQRAEGACRYHAGSLVPRGSEASELSRADRQQMARCARLAIRGSGGLSSRRSRSGHGHWGKGLGLPALLGGKAVRWDAGCLGPGEVACVWSCCGAAGLLAEGCTVGQHRHG